ncbi:MAG: phosphoribosylamine--glycine ligase [Pseudomonadota bacterium]
MNILIIGNGGREHALAWKAAQSSHVTRVYVAPGNAGTALEDKVENVDIDSLDFEQLVKFVKTNHIDFTLVGPEKPLANGIVDYFKRHELACFGPTKYAAEIESSKAFCKSFLLRHNIPTANFALFENPQNAKDYISRHEMPAVIKLDGLAAGKGVTIVKSVAEGLAAIDRHIANGEFGNAGQKLVIEEFLQGQEVSFIIITDGKRYHTLATSQDHKALNDGDTGPNTGGMGAYSPAPIMNPILQNKIQRQIIEPTLIGLAREGRPYIGFLYAGLMITPQGRVKVLEFNCRLGDPETQVLMMRLKSDLIELCIAALGKQLTASPRPEWHNDYALGVVMSSDGYPNEYPKGVAINGLNDLPKDTDLKVFHAGSKLDGENVVTSGGRVLCLTALGNTLKQAQDRAYELTQIVNFDKAHFRKDIGAKGLT